MKRPAIALPILLVFFVTIGFSQIPKYLSYQGVLTDAAGIPKPDGDYQIIFRLYDVASGGTALWASEAQTITTKRGLFSDTLGDETTSWNNLKFDTPYYLGIQVGSEAELSPRIQLMASAYSQNSRWADSSKETINADKIDGFHASATPLPNTLLPLNVEGKISGDRIAGTVTPGTHAATHNAGGSDQITVSNALIQDGSISQAKIDNSTRSIDAAKVGGKSVSEFAPTEHIHDDYYSTNDLNTGDGTPPNQGSNRMHWENLNGVPNGFSDGIDNEGGTSNHASLSNLDYSSSGHSGFAPSSGSNNYIQNQYSSGQSSNFWITGTGQADQFATKRVTITDALSNNNAVNVRSTQAYPTIYCENTGALTPFPQKTVVSLPPISRAIHRTMLRFG